MASSAVVGSSATSSRGDGGERHRDQHALAHAAGEFVRVAPRNPCRVGEADFGQQLWTRPRRSRAAQPVVERLGDLHADAPRRIEVGERILEDDREAPLPAQATQGAGRHRGDIRAVEQHAAGEFGHGDIRQQLHHGPCERGLPRAGFADDADAFAGRDHRDPRRRQRAPPCCRAANGPSDRLERESRPHAGRPGEARPLRGSTISFSPSASRLRPITAMQMARPGKTLIHQADCR